MEKRITFPQRQATKSRYYDRYISTSGVQVIESQRDVTLAIVTPKGKTGQLEITIPNHRDTLLTLADALVTVAESQVSQQPHM